MNSEFGNSPTNAILNIRKHHASEKPEFNLESKTITRVRGGENREWIKQWKNAKITRIFFFFFYRNLNGTCCFDQDPAKFFSRRRRNRLYRPFFFTSSQKCYCHRENALFFPENNCRVDNNSVRSGKCKWDEMREGKNGARSGWRARERKKKWRLRKKEKKNLWREVILVMKERRVLEDLRAEKRVTIEKEKRRDSDLFVCLVLFSLSKTHV